MAIRQRIFKKLRKLPYHREIGGLSTPPLDRKGTTPIDDGWPPNSQIVCTSVAGRKGKPVVLGWIVNRAFRQYHSKGVFLATKISYSLGKHRGHQKQSKDGTVLLVGDFLGYYNDFRPSTDFKYVGEDRDHEDALESLKEAWMDFHGMTLL